MIRPRDYVVAVAVMLLALIANAIGVYLGKTGLPKNPTGFVLAGMAIGVIVWSLIMWIKRP